MAQKTPTQKPAKPGDSREDRLKAALKTDMGIGESDLRAIRPDLI